MARIPATGIERPKHEIALERLVVSAGVKLARHASSIDPDQLALQAIESSILNRFGHVSIGDTFHAREIRDCARNLENSMIPAR